MLENILKQMEAELPDNRWAKSDFEYDKRSLYKVPEIKPFFWVVRESSTTFQWCYKEFFEKGMRSESYRFSIFRDNLAPISTILYFSRCKESKLFYFDGENLNRLSGESEMIEIYNNAMSDIIKSNREKYPLEYAMRNDKIKIVKVDEKTTEVLEKALEYAKELGDESLQRCLKRIESYNRCSTLHYVLLSKDCDQHCFYFSERIDDQIGLCGGIIYREDRTENRWQIHT